jgi:hypothetical protein
VAGLSDAAKSRRDLPRVFVDPPGLCCVVRTPTSAFFYRSPRRRRGRFMIPVGANCLANPPNFQAGRGRCVASQFAPTPMTQLTVKVGAAIVEETVLRVQSELFP